MIPNQTPSNSAYDQMLLFQGSVYAGTALFSLAYLCDFGSERAVVKELKRELDLNIVNELLKNNKMRRSVKSVSSSHRNSVYEHENAT